MSDNGPFGFGFLIGGLFSLVICIGVGFGISSATKVKYEKTIQQNHQKHNQNIRDIRESVTILLVEKDVDAKTILEVIEKFENTSLEK